MGKSVQLMTAEGLIDAKLHLVQVKATAECHDC